jgi:hypothetical protein
MPNWCFNNLTLRHSDSDAIKKLCDAYNSGETMQGIVPCPQELRDTMSGCHPAGTPEQTALERRYVENTEKYGAADWYDWCLEKWGTKWDFGRRDGDDFLSPDSDGAVRVQFETAWSPPIAFYEYLRQIGYTVEAYYAEPGVGFCGSFDNESGERDFEFPPTVEHAQATIPQRVIDGAGLENFYSLDGDT